MSKIVIDDVEFYYELYGKGQPVILISGFTFDHIGWMPLVELLKNDYQVLVFDNQGVGQTKDHGEPITAESMADRIVKLAEALKLKKPHVAGASMGGTITQEIAARHGDKIGKIALIVTTPKWRQAFLLGMQAIIKMREIGCPFEDILSAFAAWVFGEAFLLDKQRMDAFKKLVMSNPHLQTIENQKRQYEVLAKFDGRSDLKKIQNEAIIFYTEEDIISLPQESEYLAKHIPHATLIKCEGGHGIFVENPQVIAEHLKKFF